MIVAALSQQIPLNNKALLIAQKGLSCTQSRGRTGTALRPQVFETSASTDSAIWARHRLNRL
jgi:hypothetical protein